MFSFLELMLCCFIQGTTQGKTQFVLSPKRVPLSAAKVQFSSTWCSLLCQSSLQNSYRQNLFLHSAFVYPSFHQVNWVAELHWESFIRAQSLAECSICLLLPRRPPAVVFSNGPTLVSKYLLGASEAPNFLTK